MLLKNKIDKLRAWYIRKLKKAVGRFDNYLILVQVYDYMCTTEDSPEKANRTAREMLLEQINRVAIRSIIEPSKE